MSVFKASSIRCILGHGSSAPRMHGGRVREIGFGAARVLFAIARIRISFLEWHECESVVLI